MNKLRLEEFHNPDGNDTALPEAAEDTQTEDAKLAAYEQGYGAGWEDASTAIADDDARIRAELANHLQTLSFTYHEARIHVLTALEPLLIEFAQKLLPEVAQGALGPLILETMMPLAETLAEAPISLKVHPQSRAMIEAFLSSAKAPPFTMQDDISLAQGEVHLRLGEAETQIDLESTIHAIRSALNDFFEISTKDKING
jgi:flagellar biosynthesis/type III secretory pathway protein FliH